MDENKLTFTINKPITILLTLLIIAVLSSGFYQRDLWFADEPRETAIALRMYDEVNYVLPKLGNKYFVEKPPLYYWSGIALIKLSQNRAQVADIMRFNSVLWGIGTLLLTYWFALIWSRRSALPLIQQNSHSVAFLTPVLLASCNGFLANALTIRTDIALAFFVVLSAIGFSEAYVNKKAWGSWLAAIGLAGGFLTKGIIAIALSGLIWAALLPIFIKLWQEKTSAYFFIANQVVLPAFIFLLPASIWIYCLLKEGGPSAWDMWFVKNTLKRFTGGGSLGHEETNYFYYIEPFLIYTLPWGAIWLGMLVSAYKMLISSFHVRVLQLCAIFPLVLLCIATTKRPVYLLPVLPFFTVAFTFLWCAIENKYLLNKLSRVLAYLFLGCSLGAVMLACLLLPLLHHEHFVNLSEKIMLIPLWAGALLIVSLLWYFFYFYKWPILLLSQVLLFTLLVANLIVFPALNRDRSRHHLQQQLSQKSLEQWIKAHNAALTEGLEGYFYVYYKYIPTTHNAVGNE